MPSCEGGWGVGGVLRPAQLTQSPTWIITGSRCLRKTRVERERQRWQMLQSCIRYWFETTSALLWLQPVSTRSWSFTLPAHFSLKTQKAAFQSRRTEIETFGNDDAHDLLLIGSFRSGRGLHRSSGYRHINREKTTSISLGSAEHNVENQLQAFLTLLSLLTAVVQLNPAFYDDTTVYVCRRASELRHFTLHQHTHA